MSAFQFGYRDKCLSEKPEVCIVCGASSNIVVHHRDGDRTNDDLDNLSPLCEGCHYKVHYQDEDIDGQLRALRDELPEQSIMCGSAPDPVGIVENNEYYQTSINIYEYQRKWLEDSNIRKSTHIRQIVGECMDENRCDLDGYAYHDGVEKYLQCVRITPEQQTWRQSSEVNLSAAVRDVLDDHMREDGDLRNYRPDQ
jgi:hypothetical protein